MIDPLSYADIYTSEWDLYLNEYAQDIEDVQRCYEQGLITKQELIEGLDFFKARKETKNDKRNC